MTRRPRRQLLGRFALDDQLEREFDRSGMLDLRFVEACGDASLVSIDGNRSIAWLSPSGAVAGLLVTDYVNAETRIIPFTFGDLEVVNDGCEVSVFLHASVSIRAARAGDEA